MRRKWSFLSAVVFIVVFTVTPDTPAVAASEKAPRVGPVKINAHPANLEGKTVLLRWNGKVNGDKYLTRVGELLTQQVKNVKVIKLWEADKSTKVGKDFPAIVKAATQWQPGK